MKVMVADNYASLRRLYTEILTEMNHEVVAYEGHSEQITQLYEEWRPDLLIIDYDMMPLNGLEVSRFILRRFPDANIILTVFWNDRLEDESSTSGIRHVLVKPFNLSQLVEWIKVNLP